MWQAMMTAGGKETGVVPVIKCSKLSGMNTIKARAAFFFLTVLGDFKFRVKVLCKKQTNKQRIENKTKTRNILNKPKFDNYEN